MASCISSGCRIGKELPGWLRPSCALNLPQLSGASCQSTHRRPKTNLKYPQISKSIHPNPKRKNNLPNPIPFQKPVKSQNRPLAKCYRWRGPHDFQLQETGLGCTCVWRTRTSFMQLLESEKEQGDTPSDADAVDGIVFLAA